MVQRHHGLRAMAEFGGMVGKDKALLHGHVQCVVGEGNVNTAPDSPSGTG